MFVAYYPWGTAVPGPTMPYSIVEVISRAMIVSFLLSEGNERFASIDPAKFN